MPVLETIAAAVAAAGSAIGGSAAAAGAAEAGTAAATAGAGISASTVLQGIGVAGTVAGVGMGVVANQAQQGVIKAEQSANLVRQQQMTLDAMRRKRDIIRTAQIATSQSQAVSNAQGGGQSSSAEGAVAAVQGQAGVNTLGIDQNVEMGNKIFDLNKQRGDSMLEASSLSSASQGLGSLGGNLIKNSDTIARIGGFQT